MGQQRLDGEKPGSGDGLRGGDAKDLSHDQCESEAHREGYSQLCSGHEARGVAATVKAYREIGAWPQNGGDASMLEDAIRFFTERGELKPGLDAKQIVNTSILQSALKTIGKVAGSR